MDNLIYIDRVFVDPVGFENKIREVSTKLNIDPNWLMAVIYIESAGTFRAGITNEYSGATGLIQFMPNTAVSLGTSVEELAAMTAIDQLDYVYAYLKPWSRKMQSFIDVYFTVFFPVAIGKPDSYVLETSTISAKKIASQNPGYDTNKDNQVTKLEVETKILSLIDTVYHPYLKKKVQQY